MTNSRRSMSSQQVQQATAAFQSALEAANEDVAPAPAKGRRGRKPKAKPADNIDAAVGAAAAAATAAAQRAQAPKRVANDEMQKLHKLLNEMKTEIDSLKNEIRAMKAARQAPTAKQSFKSVNEALNDAKERERRSANVIIRGILPAEDYSQDHDEVQVEAFLDAVAQGIKAKKVQRLRHAKVNDKGKRNPVPSILVMLESAEDQKEVLKMARHHSEVDFKGVFAHEDRTKAQQQEFAECAKNAKDKNEKLNESGLLDQPFRYVIRGNTVRCIDSIQSRKHKKSVYVTEQQQKEYVDNLKRLEQNVIRGSISGTRNSQPNANAPPPAQGEGQ